LRILVPLDESPSALRVLPYAQALASATHGTLQLIRASGMEDDAGYQRLSYRAQQLQDAGISVEWSVVNDVDAVSAIVEAARTWRPDLVAMATLKSSALDRWLNGSVTDGVVRATDVPVLVVPPDWERPPERAGARRILVPLDGSPLAEQALGLAMRFADLLHMDLVLLRTVDEPDAPPPGPDVDDPRLRAATQYLRQVGARVQAALPGHQVQTQATSGSPPTAIMRTALNLDVDVIAMATHGRSGLRPAVLGSTTTTVLEQSAVPLVLLGPHALLERLDPRISLGAPVHTQDGQRAGQVHRVVVDLHQRAVVNLVVIHGHGLLARDVLVPIDDVDRVEDGGVILRLTAQQLDGLPDFAYHEFTTPPPTWTLLGAWGSGPTMVPVRQRERLGPAQVDVRLDTRVMALDGEIGTVDRIELEPDTGRLDALWVRAGRVFPHDIRIPAEWVRPGADEGGLEVAGSRADIEAYLGHESRARLGL
jgi:nucleotide-binding universal stress UspA family protein/sporulation protein YlmC with PRC-barrel domain